MKVHLYKRSSNGKPLEWEIRMTETGSIGIKLLYGSVGGITHIETVQVTIQTAIKEFNSRIDAKRKEGYKSIEELWDNAPKKEVFATDAELLHYLNTYLPKYNESSNGATLPMLAKTLEDNKPFDKYGTLRGQWKINGERCLVGAIKSEEDLFAPIKLTFHSRTGTEWKLPYLEEYLLKVLPQELLDRMIEEGAKLDGELYLPGYKINEINHFIKNPTAPQHKKLQYWLYDIAVESMSYHTRRLVLQYNIGIFTNSCFELDFISKLEHLRNNSQLVFLPEIEISDFNSAINARDKFIDLGFEGLILRNPNEEYDFGARRVGHMYKFKKILDGLFEIVDIIPEGKRRENLGKFVLKNDINSSTFECTYNAPHNVQESILVNKQSYIGKKVKVEYRERSGIEQVPFHAKGISIIN